MNERNEEVKNTKNIIKTGVAKSVIALSITATCLCTVGANNDKFIEQVMEYDGDNFCIAGMTQVLKVFIPKEKKEMYKQNKNEEKIRIK